VAVFLLALGIGANTAIFSLANALLRPPSKVERPDQLVLAGRTYNGSGFDTFSYPDYIDYRNQNMVFSGFVAYRGTGLYLSTGSTAERVASALVSDNYFTVLGVHAAKGRTLLPEDYAGPGAHPVAVISHGLWKRHFGFDPNVVGETINLNSHTFTVVGVMAEGFTGTEVGEALDLWLPITMYAQANPFFSKKRLEVRHIVWLQAFGRLKPNVTVEQAQAQMSTLARRLEQTYPDTNKGMDIALFPSLGFEPQRRSEVHRSTALLMIVVGLVLVIACANVANLLLARGAARQREMVIRLALGASRVRLIRQLLTEALLLALVSGLIGLLVAFWVRDLLLSFNPLTTVRPAALDLSLDGRVLGFTLLISLMTGLLCGLAPALQTSKPELASALKDRGGSQPRGSRFHSALVVGQIAVSLVVLICAGLLIRTLQKTQAVSPGFDTDKVLMAPMDLAWQGYSEAQGKLFYQQLIEHVARLPGVSSASLAVTVPLSGGSWRTGIHIEGHPSDTPQIPCDYNIVAPGYFATMGIPLVSGRDFSPRDNADAPGVVIINETFARRLFPNQNPLGQRLAMPNGRELGAYWEVVGVAQDAKYQTLREPPRPYLYVPMLQQYAGAVMLLVRADNPRALIGPLRHEVQTLDKNLLIFYIGTLTERLRALLMPQRSAATLLGGFGLLALVLASVGLYGVMAYRVSQRTHEIGIRMALGAEPGDVLKLVVGQGFKLVLIGVVIGLAAALALTRVLSSLLYGISATDPATFVGISLLLAAVALLASYIPARRASKVDPMIALRYE
jgi:predicted permease